ncbi:hypothetical protein QMK19_33920 [Streptomyces sp. H10-C2]|uniref:hypothetical protein n=1 Tax=unclassified Streptomyces TaxID=2593676 RepID=UPI0024B95065|nr:MULTISPECIES: hypothetical protein [unclassified Streptomyces]MDJ0345546.1 hypothetical protein [Streptomyces sp. PH10-H1]MDJ0374492.1 hypothetical protein [Streptomyces sp. H10-C2]
MNTSSQSNVLHTIPAASARLLLLGLGLVHVAAAPAAALGAAWLLDAQLADHVRGFARVAYIVVVAIVALAAVDRTVTDLTEPAHRLAYGRLNGPRTWSCEDCGRTIAARLWTPYEAAAFEAHLADPAAHDCDRDRRK